jgi:hypothetical protein
MVNEASRKRKQEGAEELLLLYCALADGYEKKDGGYGIAKTRFGRGFVLAARVPKTGCRRFSRTGVRSPLRNPPAKRGLAAPFAGGWGGIRTPETVSGLPVFKTGALNRSATHPVALR